MRYLCLMSIFFSLVVPLLAGEQPESSLKVMTFNIRCISIQDGKDIWFNRRKEVAQLIQKYDPDLVGLQEVLHVQLEHLVEDLPGYEWFGLARDDGKDAGERCPVFYKPQVVERMEEGTFWLSETPNVPASISWNSACRRVATWGYFREKKTGMDFYLMNTHFDHKSEEARQQSAYLVRGWLTEKAYKIPAVLIGDFNMLDTSKAYQTLSSYFLDAQKTTKTPAKGPEGTFRPFHVTSVPGKRIDYIFVTDEVEVLEYAVLDDTYGEENRRPSDHMPVMAAVRLLAIP